MRRRWPHVSTSPAPPPAECSRAAEVDLVEILSLLIPLSVALAMSIAVALWWAVKHDQFDDLDAAGARILLDDDAPQQSAIAGEAAFDRATLGATSGCSGDARAKIEINQVFRPLGPLRSPTAPVGRGD